MGNVRGCAAASGIIKNMFLDYSENPAHFLRVSSKARGARAPVRRVFGNALKFRKEPAVRGALGSIPPINFIPARPARPGPRRPGGRVEAGSAMGLALATRCHAAVVCAAHRCTDCALRKPLSTDRFHREQKKYLTLIRKNSKYH